MKSIAVIIPCHNEAYAVGGVIKKCLKYSPDVLVVDDGSQDNTTAISQYCGAHVIRYNDNRGYGRAIREGFAWSQSADIIVTIDGDGQHDADDMSKLINAIGDGYDVVIGSRFMKGNQIKIPAYRRFGIWMINLAYNFGHKPITDSQSGFRAYSRKFLDSLTIEENGFGSVTEIIIKARKQGFKIVEVPISCEYHNLSQDSHLNPFKHGFDVILRTIWWRLREGN